MHKHERLNVGISATFIFWFSNYSIHCSLFFTYFTFFYVLHLMSRRNSAHFCQIIVDQDKNLTVIKYWFDLCLDIDQIAAEHH